jgi:hypothetical protein
VSLYSRPGFRFADSHHPPLAVMTKELYLAHWPVVIRKMAVQLKGLVEGVLKKGAGSGDPI